MMFPFRHPSTLQFNHINGEVTICNRSLVELDLLGEKLLQLWVKIMEVQGQPRIGRGDGMNLESE
jgi:hypothetical protein